MRLIHFGLPAERRLARSERGAWQLLGELGVGETRWHSIGLESDRVAGRPFDHKCLSTHGALTATSHPRWRMTAYMRGRVRRILSDREQTQALIGAPPFGSAFTLPAPIGLKTEPLVRFAGAEIMTRATEDHRKTKTRIRPLADRVVVRPLEETEKMRGGLHIPDTAKEKPQQGEVVAVGPGRLEKGRRVPVELAVGQKVLYGKYSGTEITVDDQQYLIVHESDVLAVIG